MRSVLVVGLGNPGKEYEGTRHNLGIRAVRTWAEMNGASSWQYEKEYFANVAHLILPSSQSVVCLFPLTKMNRSGLAVKAYFEQHLVAESDLLVVHDDLELPVGSLKFKEGGSAVGHKGVRSIQQALGTNAIPRLRLGIGRPADEQPVEDYVLENFSAEEEAVIAEKMPEVITAITAYLEKPLQT